MMKIQSMILATSVALLFGTQSPSRATGPMGGGQQMGSQQPLQQPQPSQGNVWQQLDQMQENVQRKRALEAEIERAERGGVQNPSGGPLSQSEREANRRFFLEKNIAEQRRLSAAVRNRQKIEQDLMKAYSRHPSPAVEKAIKINRDQLNTESSELKRTNEFLKRSR